ncbi:MAG TPA: UDP-N-acetylmuramoyl-tripeptide--D-alanyl-D-alanine ligase [Trebonia sp.]|jgi:UDP-N-acetylmuramoyl-tripeptide--D-alanyl-D-alanine ligase|nr:UDP-N-acetylmuramoyl-tripeptide--D-alanyl-D-alanine ligase [Trebonia sp.]
MISLTLADIAAITGGELHAPPGSAVTGPAVTVTGPVVIDSRRAQPGSLFVALPGEHADGHDFAAAAAARGAVAALASRPVDGLPAVVVPDATAALAALAHAVLTHLPDATVVGITGSSGKTSTKDLTAQLTERLGPTVAPEGSFNNELGLPLTVLRADEDTRYLVLEMSARGPGHIAYLCEIAPPRIGAVLNVGRAHTGEFGSIEGVAKAKGELPEALPADGVAILNAGDPRVLAMTSRTRARVVTFGTGSGAETDAETGTRADFRSEGVTLDDLGRASFRLVTPEGNAPVTLHLHGEHHVANALAAAAIAAELGMSTIDIAEALSAATARSKKRMELTRRPDGVLIVNDSYNANPDSVRAGLAALAHMSRGDGHRGIAVLGHMAELGDTETASHEEAGRIAARSGVAVLVAVGAEARPVLDGARGEKQWHGETIAAPDAKAAVEVLRNELRAGDVVLVKASKSAALGEVADGLLAEADRW